MFHPFCPVTTCIPAHSTCFSKQDHVHSPRHRRVSRGIIAPPPKKKSTAHISKKLQTAGPTDGLTDTASSRVISLRLKKPILGAHYCQCSRFHFELILCYKGLLFSHWLEDSIRGCVPWWKGL